MACQTSGKKEHPASTEACPQNRANWPVRPRVVLIQFPSGHAGLGDCDWPSVIPLLHGHGFSGPAEGIRGSGRARSWSFPAAGPGVARLRRRKWQQRGQVPRLDQTLKGATSSTRWRWLLLQPARAAHRLRGRRAASVYLKWTTFIKPSPRLGDSALLVPLLSLSLSTPPPLQVSGALPPFQVTGALSPSPLQVTGALPPPSHWCPPPSLSKSLVPLPLQVTGALPPPSHWCPPPPSHWCPPPSLSKSLVPLPPSSHWCPPPTKSLVPSPHQVTGALPPPPQVTGALRPPPPSKSLVPSPLQVTGALPLPTLQVTGALPPPTLQVTGALPRSPPKLRPPPHPRVPDGNCASWSQRVGGW